RTGRGEHRYYRHPGREVRNFAGRVQGLDLRGDGGYVVAPPSLHPSGRRYEWALSPQDAPPSEMPAWLLEMATGPGEAPKDEPDWIDRAWQGFSEGQRNEAAARLAGHYLRLGMSERETLHILEGWNRANRPPLEAKELSSVVRSISRREREGGGRNFEIERVQKIQTDRPIYIARVFGCDVQIPGEALSSFSRFQQVVLQATDRMPTMRSPSKSWPHYLNDVLTSRLELLDTPEEASESAVVWSRVIRYLTGRASEEESALADGRGVYSNETHIYFVGPALKAHLDSVGVSIRAPQLWSLIRDHGGGSQFKHVRDESGQRRTVRCWTLPKSEVFPAVPPSEEASGDEDVL
ncbi:MAG TPA: bifunctional DNA primase/polymerase, partial [Acidobacteriaceae bacterium]|nr:bifunctional DNA primase/polymerase [Acidobacteriaceae bacterium]